MSHVFDLEPEFLRLYELCRDETMTSIERMCALYQATCYVIDRDVPGDPVECGLWRGARKATDEYFQTLNARPLMNRIDYTGRICVKPFEAH